MLTIHYFGEIADKTGLENEKLQTEEGNINSVIVALQEKYTLKNGEFQVAVNHEIIDLKTNRKVTETDEIALLSAFAGG